MTENELQVCELAQSILEKYFPELRGQVGFSLEKGAGDSVSGRALFGLMEIIITYRDDRILGPKYRFVLIPLIAHELAHLINPVDPDSVLRKRLPPEMVILWDALKKECSLGKETDNAIANRNQVRP